MLGIPMNLITNLWNAGRLPIKDGLYFSDGKSFFIKLKNDGKIFIDSLTECDLDSFHMSDPEWVTVIDVTKIERLATGEYFCGGEGANGSEGFFALLDSDKNLLWVTYFEELNPFFDFSVQKNKVKVKSTSGIIFDVDIDNPRNMKII